MRTPAPGRRRHARHSAAALLVLVAGFGPACGGDSLTAPSKAGEVVEGPQPPPVTLTFGAFSAASEVLNTRLLPAFARNWQRSRGTNLTFDTRFTGSEALTEAIAGGFAADVAVFAMPRDLETLAQRGVIDTVWRERPHGGIVCRSLVVLAVRKGNPKGIHNWADLVRPDVRILTPEPTSSGSGIWNVCAIYGAALRGHAGVAANDPEAARDFLARVMANVVARLPSSSQSFHSFQSGIGDVAITYESEVALGWMFGHDDERVIPTSTLLVESPAAVIVRNADAHGVRTEAEALLDFLASTEGQRHFAACGLRPVDPAVAAASRAQFPQPQDLWTIEFLGGWERIANEVLMVVGPAAHAKPGR